MLQLGARFYWPEIGRFISQDPIREGGNWYAYAGSNPVVRIDPNGLTCGLQPCPAMEMLGCAKKCQRDRDWDMKLCEALHVSNWEEGVGNALQMTVVGAAGGAAGGAAIGCMGGGVGAGPGAVLGAVAGGVTGVVGGTILSVWSYNKYTQCVNDATERFIQCLKDCLE